MEKAEIKKRRVLPNPFFLLFWRGIVLLSLLATVTNLIPVSVSFVCLVPLLPYLLLRQRSFPKLLLVALLLYGYFLASTLLYSPEALVDPSFYRRDGNFFVTFLPLLLFGLFRMPMNMELLTKRFLIFATIVGFFFMVLYLLFGFMVRPTDVYSHLFVAHNAAGGFLAVVLGLSIGFWRARRSAFYFMMVLMNAAGLFLTDSRGSILAVMGALFVHLILKGKHTGKLLLAGSALTVVLLFFAYPIWEEIGQKNGGVVQAEEVEGYVEGLQRQHTVVDRFLNLWPRAVYLWQHSPIVGTGFGSYNDVPYRFDEASGIFQLNQPARFHYNDAHAHHSFLHILAETGIVGLLLTIWFLMETFKFIKKIESNSLRQGLLIVFWTAIFSSFTEHRLFTPSQMLPFTMLLGLALGNARAEFNSYYPRCSRLTAHRQ